MRTPKEIDQNFFKVASNALAVLGVTGTEFLEQHSRQSKKRLAELIGRGVTARGLTMVLFKEARQQSSVRDLVRELLYRKLVQEFPNGWNDDGNIRPTVKLGSWHYDVVEFAPEYEQEATAILKALATTDKPESGWIPSSSDDQRLRELFNTYWPNGT